MLPGRAPPPARPRAVPSRAAPRRPPQSVPRTMADVITLRRPSGRERHRTARHGAPRPRRATPHFTVPRPPPRLRVLPATPPTPLAPPIGSARCALTPDWWPRLRTEPLRRASPRPVLIAHARPPLVLRQGAGLEARMRIGRRLRAEVVTRGGSRSLWSAPARWVPVPDPVVRPNVCGLPCPGPGVRPETCGLPAPGPALPDSAAPGLPLLPCGHPPPHLPSQSHGEVWHELRRRPK